MSKTLIISHHRQLNTGWAKVAIDYIMAMDNAGLDISVRPLLLSEPESNIPDRIKELEQKPIRECKTLIQIVLPHHLEYNSNFKCIAVFFSECDRLPSEWSTRLNMMDEVWVCNNQMMEAIINSGVKTKIRVILPPVNTEKYQRTYPKLQILSSQLSGNFSFYFIGELNKRKNLSCVIKAFHSEFDTNEPVSLVIKSSKFGASPNEVANNIQKISDEIKIGLKKYQNPNYYKRELVITNNMSDTDLLSLHSTCDCLVNASTGEAYGQPIIDAMGLGKLAIVNSVGGPKDYVIGENEIKNNKKSKKKANGLTLTEHIREPAYGMLETFPFLFTSEETWLVPSTRELQERMRTAYEMDKKTRMNITANAIETIDAMCYNAFSQKIKKILNG